MKKSSNKERGVLIIGGHVQGLGIARIFGRNDIPVAVLDKTTKNLAQHSKYCHQFIKYNKNELIEKLIALGNDGLFDKWLLMPTNDESVEAISKGKQILIKYFKVSTNDFSIVQHFHNKRLTYELATSLGIPIPRTWIANTWEKILEMDISFPCIIKPAIIHKFYYTAKKKVFLCNNFTELKANYHKALSIIPADEIIIQDVIPGNSYHQYSACFMFDGTKPLVTLTARRARQHPPDFGNATTYAETVDAPEIINYAKKLLKSINYKGICEVEFKYDERDNDYKLLEVNPRTWKWHAIAEKSESPILMSMYNYIYGFEPIVKNNFKRASFRHLITDLPTILEMKFKRIPIKKTNKDIVYAVWQKDDIKPGFFELFYVFNFLLKR